MGGTNSVQQQQHVIIVKPQMKDFKTTLCDVAELIQRNEIKAARQDLQQACKEYGIDVNSNRKQFEQIIVEVNVNNDIKMKGNLYEHQFEKLHLNLFQEVQILKLLKAKKSLSSVEIIGVDPVSSCLVEAKTLFQQAEKDLKILIYFTSINKYVESLNREDWKTIEIKPGELVVLCNFSLFLVSTDQKQNVLLNIRKLKPKLLLISEMNVSTSEPYLPLRIQQIYRFYDHIFKVSEKIPMTESEKNSIISFVQREIEDLLQENNRSLFYEEMVNWKQRIQNAGFELFVNEKIQGKCSHFVIQATLSFMDGCVALYYGGEPIVCMFIASSLSNNITE